MNLLVSLLAIRSFLLQVPALIHSTKPALHPLFQTLIDFPNMETDRCLEVYARNLLPNFTSIGNEVNDSKASLFPHSLS